MHDINVTSVCLEWHREIKQFTIRACVDITKRNVGTVTSTEYVESLTAAWLVVPLVRLRLTIRIVLFL